MDITRQCGQCGETKPFEDFYRDRTAKNGRSYRCKECHKKRVSEYKTTEEYKAKAREYQKKHYAKNKHKQEVYDKIKASFPESHALFVQ